jgi:hypothetical protein
MLTSLKLLTFAVRLMATPHDGGEYETTASDICAEYWTEGGDAHAACTVGLDTWRCERQGWCDPCESAPYEACDATLPDPIKAGQR